jgi:hypothetical protein
VGGGAYAIGKRRARREQEEQDDAYEAGYDDAAGDDPGGVDQSAMNDLERLADLKEKGILTQAEFDEQKARILGT